MEVEYGSLVGSLAGDKPLGPQDSYAHLRGSAFHWSGGSSGTDLSPTPAMQWVWLSMT